MRTSIEKVDLDKCLEKFLGNRFNLIIAASQRAREIANQRIISARNDADVEHDSKPVVQALVDIADGRAVNLR